MSHTDQNLGALHADGQGGAREIPWSGVQEWQPGEGWLWVHLDRENQAHQRWLEEHSGLDPIVREALLQEETRPRVALHSNGMIVVLRGVNLNPGSEPDDMIALRIWIDPQRVITVRHRRLFAVQDAQESLIAGTGPRLTGDLLLAIAAGLVDRQVGVIEALGDQVDGVEEEILEAESHALRTRLSAIRRQAVGLRRHLAPQREVLAHIQHERLPWIDEAQRLRMREIAEHQFRLVEELDALRDRAAIAHEELVGRLSEQLNRNMYVLSVVAGVFLPLGLLTGLLGINVAGIPGSDYPYAFAIVCGLLVGIAGFVVWLFRRIRLL